MFDALPVDFDLASCVPVSGYSAVVVLQPSDVPPNPFFLSPADGALVSAAVGAVWIAAFCWRAVRSALSDSVDV